jgi:Ca-activated chloride channel family protein
MDLSLLHFAHPSWLWTVAALPLVWLLYALSNRPANHNKALEQFADSHLLPYLVADLPAQRSKRLRSMAIWSAAWLCLVLALAGPRLSYRDVEMFKRNQNLLIILDLSESMNATDLKPSRLVRAKQKIEDLVMQAQGIKIGLIAFAADAHLLTPLTDDTATIHHLLPSISTDLIHVQGSRLSTALEMAEMLFKAEPDSHKTLLVVSDGDFEDGSALLAAKKLAHEGVIIHTMGVGTAEGAPLNDSRGHSLKKEGSPIISKLERERLRAISHVGKGSYLEADYSSAAEEAILAELEGRSDAKTELRTYRTWDEKFYLLLLPLVPFFVRWFRRGGVVAILAAAIAPLTAVDAAEEPSALSPYFYNSEQKGQAAFEKGEYGKAVEIFQDPYRKGVCHYRAGDFAAAEEMFRQPQRLEVASSAAYNLGNALAQQQKIEDAIAAYEEVLKQWPDHTKAKENLEQLKALQQPQEKEPPPSPNQSNSDQEENKGKEQQQKSEDGTEGKGEPDNQSGDSNPSAGGAQQAAHGDAPSDGQQESSKSEANNPKGSAHDSSGDSNEGGNQSINSSDAPEQKKLDSPASEPVTPESAQTSESAQVEEHQGDFPAGQQEGTNQPSKYPAQEAERSTADVDADQWLNRLDDDQRPFLKNKFYIESQLNRTERGSHPW